MGEFFISRRNMLIKNHATLAATVIISRPVSHHSDLNPISFEAANIFLVAKTCSVAILLFFKQRHERKKMNHSLIFCYFEGFFHIIIYPLSAFLLKIQLNLAMVKQNSYRNHDITALSLDESSFNIYSSLVCIYGNYDCI